MRSFSDRVAALKSRTSKIKSTSADGECMGGERENRGMKTGGEWGQQVLLNHSAGWVEAGGAIKYLLVFRGNAPFLHGMLVERQGLPRVCLVFASFWRGNANAAGRLFNSQMASSASVSSFDCVRNRSNADRPNGLPSAGNMSNTEDKWIVLELASVSFPSFPSCFSSIPRSTKSIALPLSLKISGSVLIWSGGVCVCG